MSPQRSGRHAAKGGLFGLRPRRSSDERLEALGSNGSTTNGQGPDAPAEPEGPPVPNQAGLLALGVQIEHAAPKRTKRTRRRRRVYWTLGIIGAVIILAVGAVAGYWWYLNSKIHHIQVRGLKNTPSVGADKGTQNILMVGSTSRCALHQQNQAYGLCSQGITGVNSDVVLILHLNPATKSASILSIPRDLFIPNARSDGANKIDAALADGPSQLVAAVEQDFAIPIQHYVELNFDTFAQVVDDLGGIKMYFPEPVYDAYSGLNVQTTGCRQLNGFQALQVVRARHLQYKGPGVTSTDPAYWPQEGESDLARIRRNHEFLRVLASSVAKTGLSNPIHDNSLLLGILGAIGPDQNMGLSQMVSLLLTFHGINAQTVPQWTLPVSTSTSFSFYYQGSNYGNIEFPSQALDQQTVNQFLGISNTTDSMTGLALPAPNAVTVSVQNGTDQSNQAASTASALQALGFQISGTGNVTPTGPQSETVVYYGSNNPNVVAGAQAVARSMTGSVILAYDPTQVTNGAMVTVVTGTNFAVNAPAPPPPPTTTPPPTTKPKPGHHTTTTTVPPTTTTTVPAPVSNGFTQPTQAIEALQPWDPRSCTPSGGEGP